MTEKKNARPAADKRGIAGLAARLGRLSSEKKRAALETSAALAGVSLRVSRDFVEAVPKAAKVLSADDLRAWGELGRRLAMGNAETGSQFFRGGVKKFAAVPADARPAVFQVVTRQLILSSSIALKTFEFVPELAKQVNDDRLFTDLVGLSVEIAQRSAKHSSDFLIASVAVAAALERFGDEKVQASAAILRLGKSFAGRTGGMTADLWTHLPAALAGLSAENVERLAAGGEKMLESGGSVTLNFIAAGAEVMRRLPAVFDDWQAVVEKMAAGGNVVLIGFLRATPRFLREMAKPGGLASSSATAADVIPRVLELTGSIAETDADSALAAFRSSVQAMKKATLEQFEDWIAAGLTEKSDEPAKARRSYFALETRQSNELLRESRTGLSLDGVSGILRIYVEGLTGREIEIAPVSAAAGETRIGDGKLIYLPAVIEEFPDDDENFRLFKVLAAHGAGQIEFGTFAADTPELKAVYTELAALYEATADQIDAFSLAGYIADVQTGEKALGEKETAAEMAARERHLPAGGDHRTVLQLFPEPRLARRIFGTMENARIDRLLRKNYRGLRKDLDLMQRTMAASRPYIFDLPMQQVPGELLFQITLCGGASDDARRFYGQIVSEIETVVERAFYADAAQEPTVADSLLATSRVYALFQDVSTSIEKQQHEEEKPGEYVYEDKNSGEAVTQDQVKIENEKRKPRDIKDLFNAWNEPESDDDDADDVSGGESWAQHEMPELPLEPGDEAFSYDEWDRELGDYRVGWSRVIEKKVKHGDRSFVELARSRYRGVISSLKHQFQLLRPENLTRIRHEVDGEDHDFDELLDSIIDRRANGNASDRFYIKKLRRERDVAVSILLDQSSSTARTITRNPLQPYTYPGRRIIEIEKEGLVLMTEALEAVGDLYSIYGFTSEGRRNVKFYVVKDFREKYSEEIEKRIGGITFQNNTRLGASIRHAASKLLRQDARTKLLIVLTDGRPYDHDYGDAKYAREDVREALTEAKMNGITPFCITIDRESEAELKDLYGEVGYTIIDDVMSLPERIPSIYRRLTT